MSVPDALMVAVPQKTSLWGFALTAAPKAAPCTDRPAARVASGSISSAYSLTAI